MSKLRLLSILFVLAILSACGGGNGGGGNAGDSKTSVVTASAVSLGAITAMSNVSLDASASSDSLNGNLTYIWIQTSGTTVKIANTSSASTSFTAPAATDSIQTLAFQVTVSSATDSDMITITGTLAAEVTPISVVTASAAQLLDTIPATSHVSLDASASSDSLNGDLTYLWSQISGTNVVINNDTSAIANFTSPAAIDVIQTLVFQVTVSSATDSDTATLTATISAEVVVQPNILFILSDDQGLDASAQYNISTDLPNTPTLNALAASGITFDNAWATPACTTTRGTIITGKFGVNSGIDYVPASIDENEEVIQEYLANNQVTANYASALFGKWHLGTDPNDVGIDYYAGNMHNPADYYNWDLTINGQESNSTEYHTTKITDLAKDWINGQTTPWFAWVAYSAPHSPFHLPPADLHERDQLTGETEHINANKREYYLAAVEAMDSEISRLLNSLDSATLANTIIIYLGDNGSPKAVSDGYLSSHSKGTLYQGGVAVPLVISGKGVTRQGIREDALITATDLYATFAEIAGIDNSNIHDSNSFAALLTNENSNSQDYVYTQYKTGKNIADLGWTVRSSEYKLINFEDNTQAAYALDDFYENEDLLPTANSDLLAKLTDLETIANNITGNNSGTPIDITNAILTNGNGNCASYVEDFTSTVNDVNNATVFYGDLVISLVNDKCIFYTNEIPNHDFNDREDGNKFPNNVSVQDHQFEVTATPSKAVSFTELSLQTDNAILLNGVKVDLLAAACYGVGGQPKGDEKIGCNDGNDWRYDPMSLLNGFKTDTHNAHAQPDGSYHYHGSPNALFVSDDNSVTSPVIGFAADGFPIFGSYFDDNGTIRKAISSYQLKTGSRPSGVDEPGEAGEVFSDEVYNGRFRDDYQYVESYGDLDECNGMTVNGVYGYYVTDSYPYMMACFSGTPDESFDK